MARNKYDVDESIETKMDFALVKRLGSYLLPHRKKLIAAILIMLSASALAMLIPQFTRKMIDVYIPNSDRNGVIKLSAGILAVALYVSIALKIKIKLTAELGQSIIKQLRSDIFTHLQKLPFSYYDDRPHGKIQVRVVNYVNSLSDLLSNGIINTITDLCSLFFILIFMFSMNITLTLICLCGLPILGFIVFFIKKRQRRAWQLASNKLSNLNAFIAESINGIRVTQSFVREQKNLGIFNDLSSHYKSSWMNAVKYNFIIGPAVDNISTVTTAFIFLLGVYWLGGNKLGISVGIMIAFTGYISSFWAPITTLASFYNSLLTAISYLERIFETIDEPVAVKDKEDAINMPDILGTVRFEHVAFAYEDGIPILHDINFEAKPGESYAIVGPTGAGKTTIVNLISRFYNLTSGTVYVDDIDISSVTLKSLRTQMGIMMQDSFIFSGTIMDNIRYGNNEASEEAVIKAAQTVCAHDFIINLENGYNTQVNERGSRLSVGQRQLISFARALLANPRILILDEATSSIDTETEIVLQKGLHELLKGRTSFIIAHRLSTVRNCNKILYVDKGAIMEMGNHEELMNQRGKYYQLQEAQKGNV